MRVRAGDPADGGVFGEAAAAGEKKTVMISRATPELTDPLRSHTIWGLDTLQLHDRFWAARGVQVVRQGQPIELVSGAELYMLIDPHCLSIFRMGEIVDSFAWLRPELLMIRLHNTRERGYRERIVTDAHDRFQSFERHYGTGDFRLQRIGFTPSKKVAVRWQQNTEKKPWKGIRRSVAKDKQSAISVEGSVYDSDNHHEVNNFLRELVSRWKRPDTTISRAVARADAKRRDAAHATGAWVDAADAADPDGWAGRDRGAGAGLAAGRTQARRPGPLFIGPVWVGAGRDLSGVDSVVGPAVLWDAPERRPRVDKLEWNAIEPTKVLVRPTRVKTLSSLQRGSKRVFDIAFALAAGIPAAMLTPLIMLAIYLEDGRPFLFGHVRETRNGREFRCWKFRTMYNNAEHMKASLVQKNQADGPQFFIENDPRITRVGHVLRKLNFDELPQFWNVFRGEMSVVGPRPSPFKENQYCPPWREARLSVRPGITGLWQVNRSREEGKDFQEWIDYDIQYVENVSWKLDLWILAKQARNILMKGSAKKDAEVPKIAAASKVAAPAPPPPSA